MTGYAPTSVVDRRPVTDTDESFLRGLFAESRKDLMILPADVRDALVDMQFRAQRRQYSETFPQAQHDVILADGVPVGRLIVETSATGVRIVDVTVHQAHRGRGIASSVLTGVLAQADRERRPVRLSVWADNTDARRLYGRLGFAVTEAVPGAGAGARAGTGYFEMARMPAQERGYSWSTSS